jgi:hypothetical protein
MNGRGGTGKATEKESGQRAGSGGGPHRQHHRAIDQDTRDFFSLLFLIERMRSTHGPLFVLGPNSQIGWKMLFGRCAVKLLAFYLIKMCHLYWCSIYVI